MKKTALGDEMCAIFKHKYLSIFALNADRTFNYKFLGLLARQYFTTGVLNLVCLVYPLPNENSIFYPHSFDEVFWGKTKKKGHVIGWHPIYPHSKVNLPPGGKFTPG